VSEDGPLEPWRVHIPTVEETCVRLRCEGDAESAPWPLARALVELGRLGLRPTARFRSLGRGRGQPILHSQEASWRGLEVHLESAVTEGGRTVEAALALPGMEEVVQSADEPSWWELADTFAAAVGGRHGALADGEAVEMEDAGATSEWRRRLGRHLGLLVPERVAAAISPCGDLYTRLPMSGLTVVLR
jgi:hypothetical protein